MRLCRSCGRPMMEHMVCICKQKSVGTWGPWKNTTKEPPVLTPQLLKKFARLTKCGPAVEAARRRVQQADSEFLQGGEEPQEEEPDYE